MVLGFVVAPSCITFRLLSIPCNCPGSSWGMFQVTDPSIKLFGSDIHIQTPINSAHIADSNSPTQIQPLPQPITMVMSFKLSILFFHSPSHWGAHFLFLFKFSAKFAFLWKFICLSEMGTHHHPEWNSCVCGSPVWKLNSFLFV